MKEKFIEIYKDRITRPGADKLLEWLEGSDFFIAPASTRFHLARPGGLVEHSVHVYERLRVLCNLEEESEKPLTGVSAETIAIVSLLHDVCKIGIYRKAPKNQKTYDPEKVKRAQKWQVKHDELGDFIWESVMGYEFDDPIPYGHGEKSVYMVSSFMKLSREESMAIRWHMGFTDNDFRGGGQNVGKAFEKYPLALLLHLADLQATYLDEVERSPEK